MIYRVYVGLEKDQFGASLPRDVPAPAVLRARTQLVDVFGGYTAFATYGGYRTASGHTIHEKSALFEVVSADEQHDFALVQLRKICQELATALNQESVLLVATPTAAIEFIEQSGVRHEY